jgi:hypothetical protein
VGTLTFFFKGVVSTFFPEPIVPGSDAHVFRELLVQVWNQILLKLENGHLSAQDAIDVGFMLRRVYVVAEAFKSKQETYTLVEWVQKLVVIAKEAGVPVPA